MPVHRQLTSVERGRGRAAVGEGWRGKDAGSKTVIGERHAWWHKARPLAQEQ